MVLLTQKMADAQKTPGMSSLQVTNHRQAGRYTRKVLPLLGWLLAAFCVFTGVAFHLPYASGTELVNILNQIMVMKNFTLAGASILLATVGAGAYSIDARRGVSALTA